MVATDAAHEQLIELLVGARLVTSDDGVVELAHEALARAWPRLQGWLDEDVEGQRILRHLAGAADTWDAMGRPDSELYRGARLAQALEWRERATPDLTPTERAFLDASRDPRRHRAARRRGPGPPPGPPEPAASRPAHRDRAIFLVGALVAGFVAVGQRERAEREGRVATARELAAAANANLDVDPERSILLALEAVERSRSGRRPVLPEAEEALHTAVTASRIELRVPGVGGRLDWSPDGTVFVTEGPEGSGIVDIRDARHRRSVRSFQATTATSPMSRSTTTARCSPPRATTGRRGSGTRPPARSCTPSRSGPYAGRASPVRRSAPTARSSPPHGPTTGWSRSSTSQPGSSSARSVPSRNRGARPSTRPAHGSPSLVATAHGPVVDVVSGNEVFALEGHVRPAIWTSPGVRTASRSPPRALTAVLGSSTPVRTPRFAVLDTGGNVYSVDWAPTPPVSSAA